MSFNKLSTITQNLNLVDTNQIFEQGRRAYNAMFTRAANPFKSERDRAIWDRGYTEAMTQFTAMLKRWKEQDGGSR